MATKSEFGNQTAVNAPTDRAGREKYHGLAMDYSKAMKLVKKGTAEGLTSEEYRDYQNTVNSLRKRVKQYQADMASAPITKNEENLLNKVLKTQGTWEKHDDKPFIVDGKAVDSDHEQPRREPTHSGSSSQSDSKSHGKKKTKESTYRQERIDEAKENLNIAMRLAQKGTKAGLSEEEAKDYRKAVKALKRRVNVLTAMAGNGRASAEEIELLRRLKNTRNTWEKHNGKPLKASDTTGDKEDEEKLGPPVRYEPSPLDLPLVSEAIDEFAQTFGYGTYGDKKDRISYLLGAWLKNRASEVAKDAKNKVVNHIKDSFRNSDDEPSDLYEGNDPEFTAFLFEMVKHALQASKGDKESLSWLNGEGQDQFDYWYKQEVWGDDQSWFDDPRLVDDLNASFEVLDLDENGNPVYDEEIRETAPAEGVADQQDLQEWVSQQKFDETEAYMVEHPGLRLARNVWLRYKSLVAPVKRFLSNAGKTLKNVFWKPTVEYTKMTDEEWERKVAHIKAREQIWVGTYTKSDGTKVKGHNKSVYKNVRR